MSFESQVEQLTESTKTVLQDCALENGAIVAGNSDLPYYPETAVNYRYVWPRDAAFTIYAADVLGFSPDTKVNFVQWLLERAEGFSESGTIIKRYGTNGRHDLGYGQAYQPDQAGAMLWALHDTSQEPDAAIDKAIALLANGLSGQWEQTHFVHPTDINIPVQDLWEDRSLLPEDASVFTYSLASAICGLERALVRLGDSAGAISDNWSFAADSMRKVLQKVGEQQTYPWKLPVQPDQRQVDASLSGLIWPFEVNPETNDVLGPPTLQKIEEVLHKPGWGIKRYVGDCYDGLNYASDKPENSGTWPLLSFWYVIALKRSGLDTAADAIYRETLENLPNDYIPEQLLPSNRTERPPAPLAWAHSMFIIASQELGYLS